MIKKIDSYINLLVSYSKYISMLAEVVMMLFITFAVIMRNLNMPIMGDYETVQLLMLVLVMMGIPYVQQINAHISIGLIVGRLSAKSQTIFNALAYLLTFLVSGLIGFINIQVAVEYFFSGRTTRLMHLPLYPFILILGVGFILWSLVALYKFIKIFAHQK